jgi:hypothetical protein
MSFQVNQSSNINEETADVVFEGVKIVRIVKKFGEPAVVSIYADGPEPTHVIDMAMIPKVVMSASKKPKVVVPIE